MKAIVNTGPDKLELLELPTPEPGTGQVRIRVGACGVCATDLEMIAGWTRTGFPAIPGHEWAGTVEAIGPQVDPAFIGRRCVAENVLSDGGEVGFEHPGGYGEYLLTEARNLHVLPDDFPIEEAALIEPLAVCVHGLGRLRIEQAPQPVLIFGDGPMGLLMTALLAHRGFNDVCLVGGRGDRLALAAGLGAAATLNYHDAGNDLTAAIKRIRPLFPIVIEASGSAPAIEAALLSISAKGRILVLGDYGAGKAHFPWNDLLHKEIELIGSNASAGAWPQAVGLATSRAIPLDRLVSRCYPVADYPNAIAAVKNRTSKTIKAVLIWHN